MDCKQLETESCVCPLQWWYSMLKAPILTVNIFTWLIWVSSTKQPFMHRSRKSLDPHWRATTGEIIHSSSTHRCSHDRTLEMLPHSWPGCHRGSWFHFRIMEMPKHLPKDMKRKSSNVGTDEEYWRIWKLNEIDTLKSNWVFNPWLYLVLFVLISSLFFGLDEHDELWNLWPQLEKMSHISFKVVSLIFQTKS